MIVQRMQVSSQGYMEYSTSSNLDTWANLALSLEGVPLAGSFRGTSLATLAEALPSTSAPFQPGPGVASEGSLSGTGF